MYVMNATDVRKDFSAVLDKTVREKPQFIRRTRDYLMLLDMHFLESLLDIYCFTADRFLEDNNSVTLSLNEIDIVENGGSEAEARKKLALAILDYAEDFYKDFTYWGSAPNRKAHIPYVFKVLALGDVEKVGALITCRDGKN